MMQDDPTPPESAPPDAMARFRRWAAIAVAIAVIGWVGYALVRGFSETGRELVGFPWLLSIPVLLLTLVNYGLRYLKWHYLLGRLGIHIEHRHDAPIFLAGLAMVISPAKAGEVVKPWLVRTISGAPMARTIPALVAERGTDGIAVVALAAIGVSTYASEATSVIWLTIAAIVGVLVVIAVEPLSRGLIGVVAALPLVGGLASRLDDAYSATRTVLAPVPLVVTVALSMVAWFAECIGAWLIFQGLQTTATLDQSTFLYAFSTVFGAPSPGGLGMADVALAEGALQIVDGISEGQALAASLLVRLATLWFGVVLGAFALLRMERVIDDARSSRE